MHTFRRYQPHSLTTQVYIYKISATQPTAHAYIYTISATQPNYTGIHLDDISHTA